MLPQPAVVIEAIQLLITPGNVAISQEKDDSEQDSDGLDMILENSLKDYTEKINTDTKYSGLNSFWIERKTRYFQAEASLKWKFASACLVLIEALAESLREASNREQKGAEISDNVQRTTQTSDNVKSNKKKTIAPRLPADALSINQQKVFINTMQFILCLGVYPHLAKGVGIPLERRSGYGLLLTSSVSDVRSLLERQFRLVLVARAFSACLEQTSLSSLLLSRHLGDCLAVIFQLCYGVKKKPKEGDTSESNNAPPKNGSDVSDNASPNPDHAKSDCKTLESPDTLSQSDSPLSTNNLSGSSNNNNTQETASIYRVAITEKDVEFCQKFLEDLKKRSFQPSLVKELLLLQGVPGPKLIKSLQQSNPLVTNLSTNLNLPPAPAWLKNACSQILNKILLSKPNGVSHIVQGMLDVPVSSTSDETQNYQKCEVIAKVIATRPPSVASDDEYYKQIAPQVIELIRDSNNDQYPQMIRISCCAMEIVSSKSPFLFEKYFLKSFLKPFYSCIEGTHDCSIESEQIVVNEYDLNKCIEETHKVFVSGSEPQAELLNQLRPFVHVIFSIFCFTDMTLSNVRSLTEEILLVYLKFVDINDAMNCLKAFVFSSLSKDWDLGIRLMHPRLMFAAGDNDCPRVVTKPEEETDDEQLDLLCDESERTGSLLNLICKLDKEVLSERFLVYMLQELTRTLNEETPPDDFIENESSGHGSTELLDIEKRQQENTDQVFYQLTILNFLAAVYEKLGPAGLKSTKHVLEFIKATLMKGGIDELDPVEKEFGGIFNNEILTMSLGMLTAVIAGALDMTAEDQKTLTGFIPLLQNLIVTTGNYSIKAMASSLRVAIATYGKVWPGMEFAENYEKECKQGHPSENNSKLITELPDNTRARNSPQNEAAAPAKDSKRQNKKKKKSVKKESVDHPTSSHSKSCHINKEEVSKNIDLAKNTSLERSNEHVIAKQTDPITKHPSNPNPSNPNLNPSNPNPSNPNPNNPNPSNPNRSNPNRSNPNPNPSNLNPSNPNPSTTSGKISTPPETNTKISRHSELQDALKETYDSLIPVQGHGLITLTKLIKEKQREAVKKQDLILHVFEEKLTHPDSYIYLSAVNGLAAMAEVFPEKVVPRLIELFSDPESEIQNGEAVPSEMKIKLGESIVKASRSLGSTIPKYRDLLLNAFLQGAKDEDPLVRASSLSNLGEACKLLHFSLGNVIHEIVSCCSSMAKSDPSVDVRAAAVLLITQLLQGLGTDALHVLEFVMKDLYQLLKSIMIVEKEDQVKLHANLALNELADIMKETLFPKQTLTKKIRVLDAQ